MDQAVRNKLRNVVTQCRKLLEESISQQLQGQFGIYPGKKDAVQVDDASRMGHLSDEDRQYRRDLLDHLEHIRARGFKPREALDQLVREIAFTHLNRLCAYKMMEAREVYVGGRKFREAVSRGTESNGFKFYLADHPEDERLFKTGQQELAYRHFLDWLGGLLSEEIGVLFNPNDPANRLYPRQKTLDALLDLLNGADLKPEETQLREAWPTIWQQDETIGWVYQYFTPKELRDQARKESQAPRNSYELAFRNQFFTPRYVVEFLTDNTLGRIWYEMRKGDTRLKDQCRYLVRRPTEVFLEPQMHTDEHGSGTSEESCTTPASDICVDPCSSVADSSDSSAAELTQEELLKQPVYIPHRPKKDPRELKILDPACGSGHFLLYCFDLLLTIYEEAYNDPDLGPALQRDYATLDDLRRDVPRLILAHNLHGIDIDLRATQIAALALWLRAQRAYQQLAKYLGPRTKQQFPKITRSNLVCAEPMPGEEGLLEEFLKTLHEDRLEQLIRRVMNIPANKPVRATEEMADRLCELVRLVWDKMNLAGQAGSLLKIEEELHDAVRKGQEQWEEKQPLFRISQYSVTEDPQQTWVRFVSGERLSFWERAESLVMAALDDFAAFATDGRKLLRKLFVNDAMRGFAFVDACRRRFDVILMNPPFGSASQTSKDYIGKVFSNSKDDIDAAFVTRGLQWLQHSGFLGVIANRTELFKPSLRRWRERRVFGDSGVDVLADLGFGVLDSALVETAAYVLRKPLLANHSSWFSRELRYEEKDLSLSAHVTAGSLGVTASDDVFVVKASSFQTFPEARLSYWAPAELRRSFQEMKPLDPTFVSVQKGTSTTDDFRFLRLAWEVAPEQIARSRDDTHVRPWAFLQKGGEYAPYFADIHLVINWKGDGLALHEFLSEKLPYLNGNTSWVLHPESNHFCPGITYSVRTASGFSPRVLPSGCVFSHAGNSMFPVKDDLLLPCLGILMSRPVAFLLELLVAAGDAAVSGSAARSYEVGVLRSLPFPDIQQHANSISDRVASIWRTKCAQDAERETSRYFVVPGVAVSRRRKSDGTLRELAEETLRREEDGNLSALAAAWGIEKIARALFNLSEGAIREIEYEFGRHPEEYSTDRASDVDESEFARRYISRIDDMIDEEVAEAGASRTLTKKYFFADRRLELLSSTFDIAPRAVTSVRRRLQLISREFVEEQVHSLLGYCVGCVAGRWDVRFATGNAELPLLPQPDALLPSCQPGMLKGPDRLPSRSTPRGYPIRIDSDAILVDDIGDQDDVVRRVRDVLDVIWNNRADAIEKEACEILGVKTLRDYFRKPGKGGFWDDHVKRYSKSRRKAPIYWLLQSSRKNYALWLYYHRLDKDMLFKALVNYVEPKIQREENRLAELRSQTSAAGGSGKGAKKVEREIERQEDLLSELGDFADKLRRAANLHLVPDLNDGVVLNIAPLWELVPWNEAKKYWHELLDGKYEWSSIGKQLREKGLVK